MTYWWAYYTTYNKELHVTPVGPRYTKRYNIPRLAGQLTVRNGDTIKGWVAVPEESLPAIEFRKLFIMKYEESLPLDIKVVYLGLMEFTDAV